MTGSPHFGIFNVDGRRCALRFPPRFVLSCNLPLEPINNGRVPIVPPEMGVASCEERHQDVNPERFNHSPHPAPTTSSHLSHLLKALLRSHSRPRAMTRRKYLPPGQTREPGEVREFILLRKVTRWHDLLIRGYGCNGYGSPGRS